jgi:hypothetical protein
MKSVIIFIILINIYVRSNASYFKHVDNEKSNRKEIINSDFNSYFKVSQTELDFIEVNKNDSLNYSLRRKYRPIGFGITAFGPSLAYGSVSANYYLLPCMQLEAGTDIRSIYGGFNWYPFARKKDPLATPYLGAFLNYTTNQNWYEFSDAPVKGFKGYFPLGVQFFTKTGIVVSAEVAYSTPEYFELNNIFWGIKIGYQFLKAK